MDRTDFWTELAQQKMQGTDPADDWQVDWIDENIDNNIIWKYFGKSAKFLTGGEANLAILAGVGEIGWDDVEVVLFV